MAKVKHIGNGIYTFICPGCGDQHTMHTKGKNRDGAQWTFDGNMDSPTFKPSIKYKSGMYAKPYTTEHHAMLVAEGLGVRCHFILTAGILSFCNDSTHAYAQKKLPLPEISGK